MIEITVKRDGETLEEIKAKAYMGVAIGETDDSGTRVHQMMAAEDIGEKEFVALLMNAISIVHEAVKSPELADSIIDFAVAKAKMKKVFKDLDGEEEE